MPTYNYAPRYGIASVIHFFWDEVTPKEQYLESLKKFLAWLPTKGLGDEYVSLRRSTPGGVYDLLYVRVDPIHLDAIRKKGQRLPGLKHRTDLPIPDALEL